MEFEELHSLVFEFCSYFNDKVSSLKDTNIRGFKNTNIYKNKLITTWNELGLDELKIDNFMVATIVIMNKYDKSDFVKRNIHLNKESDVIFKFVSNILKTGTRIDDKILEEKEKDKLRLIHSKLSTLFINDDGVTSYLEKLIEERLKRFTMPISKPEQSYKEDDNVLCAKNNPSFIRVKRIYNKHIRYNNHINIMKIHATRKTTPKSLFYNQFPLPFLKDDAVFIEAYNKIIAETQTKTMNLIKTTFETRVENLDKELDKIKEDFGTNAEFVDLDLNKIFEECKRLEEKNLSGYIKKSKYKAERCVNFKYSVEQFEENNYKNHRIKSRAKGYQDDNNSHDSRAISRDTSTSFDSHYTDYSDTAKNTRRNSKTRFSSKQQFLNSQNNGNKSSNYFNQDNSYSNDPSYNYKNSYNKNRNGGSFNRDSDEDRNDQKRRVGFQKRTKFPRRR